MTRTQTIRSSFANGPRIDQELIALSEIISSGSLVSAEEKNKTYEEYCLFESKSTQTNSTPSTTACENIH